MTASPSRPTPAEIAEIGSAVADDNFRIEAAEDGIHIYNRAGPSHRRGCALTLFRRLGVESDGAPCVLSRLRAGQGPYRLAARQALCAGRAARLGLRRRPAGGGPAASEGGRPYAPGQAAARRAMP